MKSTTRPQENLVVGVGLGICPFLPEDHKIFNLGGKILFVYIFVLESTTRPQENLVVGVGLGICPFLPEDHKIFNLGGKILFCGGGGV